MENKNKKTLKKVLTKRTRSDILSKLSDSEPDAATKNFEKS